MSEKYQSPHAYSNTTMIFYLQKKKHNHNFSLLNLALFSSWGETLGPLPRSIRSIESTEVTKIITQIDRKLQDESIKSN
jgi:hypothetical protein